jgi:hypothetical protein
MITAGCKYCKRENWFAEYENIQPLFDKIPAQNAGFKRLMFEINADWLPMVTHYFKFWYFTNQR